MRKKVEINDSELFAQLDEVAAMFWPMRKSGKNSNAKNDAQRKRAVLNAKRKRVERK